MLGVDTLGTDRHLAVDTSGDDGASEPRTGIAGRSQVIVGLHADRGIVLPRCRLGPG